ncbi:12367_t:CDS:2, partial [Acaulospora morrowiae]
MSTVQELELLVKDLDITTTEIYVADFLNSHFCELEDLEKLDSILNDLKKNEQILNEKCVQLQNETLKPLQQSLKLFDSTIVKLEELQATRLELQDTLAEHCDKVTSKNLTNSQGKSTDNNVTLLEQLVSLQKQVDSLERSKQYLKILVVAEEL